MRIPDNPIKMLVADDHRIFIYGLAALLQRETNIQHIEFAANGKEALDKGHRGFEIILMDINMPILDGIEATAEIRRRNEDVKIIILSMLADFQTVRRALKAGANGYLLKSTDQEELLTAIKMVQRGEIYLSQSLSGILETDHHLTSEEFDKKIEQLVTPRERSILKLIVEGKTDGEISGILNISDKTVSTHRKNMLAKLNLRNTAQLVKFAMDNQLH